MPQSQKRGIVGHTCRVCAQDCLMEQECIMCDGCECWLHQECIRMSTSQYIRFCAPHLQFFCKHCVTNGDSFCVSSSLSRIVVLSPDIKKMQDQANSELNLMQFYCIALLLLSICLVKMLLYTGSRSCYCMITVDGCWISTCW